MAGLKHPVTSDGRYFVVRGRLWRLSNPHLSDAVRAACVSDLMAARRAVKSAKAAGDRTAEAAAHHAVDNAKRELGERGEVWWTDGSPDLNRHMIKNTPYSAWYPLDVTDAFDLSQPTTLPRSTSIIHVVG